MNKDLLYVLRHPGVEPHSSHPPQYLTTYLKSRSWLISSNERSTMDLLRTTLTHHNRRYPGAMLTRGVFYREHPTEHNKDALHLTDVFPAAASSTDLSSLSGLDLVTLDLDSPSDVDWIRRMYQFANTSLFLVNDYDYDPSESHLRIEGLAIALPETHLESMSPDEPADYNPNYFYAYKEFLNSLYLL